MLCACPEDSQPSALRVPRAPHPPLPLLCLQAGLAPTHQIINQARAAGFENVHDYLVGSGRECPLGREGSEQV